MDCCFPMEKHTGFNTVPNGSSLLTDSMSGILPLWEDVFVFIQITY